MFQHFFKKIVRGYCVISCRIILLLCGYFNVSVKGKIDPSAKIVVVAPHTTIVDSLYLLYYYNFPVILTKAMDNIITGPILQCMDAIQVQRESSQHKDTVMKQMQAHINLSNKPLLIFPEGTCTNRSSLISFRRGAFNLEISKEISKESLIPVPRESLIPVPRESLIPVQPVLLKLSGSTWTISKYGMFQAILMLFNPINHMEIEFLPKYVPNKMKKMIQQFMLITLDN